MKRVAVFLTLVVALGGCRKPASQAEPPPAGSAAGSAASAPTAPPTPTADTDAKKIQRPLFWSLEKDGKTSYALGTIHMGVDAAQELPSRVFAKLEASPAFAMETDLSDPSILKALECVKCSLQRDLDAKHYGKLQELLGQPVVKQIDGMKPMVAATMVAMRGLPSTAQMDSHLLALAQEKKQRIVFLEAAAHQAAMLEKWMNLKALRLMLDDPETSLESTKQLLAAYVAGDDAKMLELSAAQRELALAHGYTAKEYDASQEDMLFKRNASWIEPIEKLHAEGGGFIAVGALHLIGPRSVLELLEQKGFKITRL